MGSVPPGLRLVVVGTLMLTCLVATACGTPDALRTDDSGVDASPTAPTHSSKKAHTSKTRPTPRTTPRTTPSDRPSGDSSPSPTPATDPEEETLSWLPFGPADKLTPSPRPRRYGTLQSKECGGNATKSGNDHLDGSPNASLLYDGVVALCNALQTADPAAAEPYWQAAADALGQTSGDASLEQNCYDAAALDVLTAFVNAHKEHPERRIRWGSPRDGRACDPTFVDVTTKENKPQVIGDNLWLINRVVWRRDDATGGESHKVEGATITDGPGDHVTVQIPGPSAALGATSTYWFRDSPWTIEIYQGTDTSAWCAARRVTYDEASDVFHSEPDTCRG